MATKIPMSLPPLLETWRQRWSPSAVVALSLYLAALVLALAAGTYDADPESGRFGANILGSVGRILVGPLVEAVGIGCFLPAFFFVLLALAVRRSQPIRGPLARAIGLASATFLLGVTCQILGPRLAYPGHSAPLGGILGHASARRLAGALGLFGGAVIAGLSFLASALLALGPDLWPFGRRVGTDDGSSNAQRAVRVARARGAASRPRSAADDPGIEAAAESTADAHRLSRSLDMATVSALAVEELPSRSRPGRNPSSVDEAEEVEEVGPPWDEPTATRPRALVREEELVVGEEEVIAGSEVESAWEEDADEDADEGDADNEPEEDEDEDDEADEDEDAEESDDEEWDEEEDLLDPEPDSSSEEADEVPGRRPPVIITAETDGETGEGLALIRLERDRGKGRSRYVLPPLDLLDRAKPNIERESDAAVHRRGADLEEALKDFNISATVGAIERGPVITRFDLTLSRGTKISKVTGLADDLALTLGASRVRVAPVKGQSSLGVEIPNQFREMVCLQDVAANVDLRSRRIAIPLFLGKDAAGRPMVEDLAATPHLLIAGRTGTGKSVFINSLVLSILLTRYPEEVRLIMIDPKKVELEVYQDIPHLMTRVESSPKKAAKILEWAVDQMEERYEYLAAVGVRHLTSYNKLASAERVRRLSRLYSDGEIEKIPGYLPYIVIIVDELADLMMASGKEVEQAIARLSQKARAVGIHVVLATQRPSTDVITGLIKSNLPARIAFQTRTGIDSRTILDRYGAEKLLDRGDMLYLSASSDDPKRMQGPFVSDEEVERVVAYLKEHAAPLYQQHLEQVGGSSSEALALLARDDMFEQAVDTVFATGQASASFLQRRLQVGYARASRLIDLMGEAGIVSEHRGSKAREILISAEQWEEMRRELGRTASN